MGTKRTRIICLSTILVAQVCQAQTLVPLHSFVPSTDGYRPESGLVLRGDTLYGATIWGGIGGGGTVFKIDTDGTGFTVLHSSRDPDWMHPNTLLLNDTTL